MAAAAKSQNVDQLRASNNQKNINSQSTAHSSKPVGLSDVGDRASGVASAVAGIKETTQKDDRAAQADRQG